MTFSQVATGIGITPFASILQSLMFKYWASKSVCPSCDYKWSRGFTESSDFKLKKVDFIWVNREQRAFEWFLQLLTQLEMEQVSLRIIHAVGHLNHLTKVSYMALMAG